MKIQKAARQWFHFSAGFMSVQQCTRSEHNFSSNPRFLVCVQPLIGLRFDEHMTSTYSSLPASKKKTKVPGPRYIATYQCIRCFKVQNHTICLFQPNPAAVLGEIGNGTHEIHRNSVVPSGIAALTPVIDRVCFAGFRNSRSRRFLCAIRPGSHRD